MNYIKHLTGFFEKVAIDKSLNPTHVSLYIALFQFWNCNRFKNPISISRDEVMRISKISSKATYHKCLKNLHSLGYINYEPSYNPFKGSHVYLFNFSDDLKPIQKNERKPKNEPLIEPVSEQALNKSCTSDETSSEQALVPSINYINNTNNLNNENVSNLNEQAKNFQESNNDFVISTIGNPSDNELAKQITSQEKKLRKKKKGFIQPNLHEIKSYFQENSFPELEAQKFFNYFSSNGWLVGGKTPMVDWQAAAQNWILNSINFNHNTTNSPPNRAKHLNTGTDKDYSEPL
ncbi:transcriptional regulator [Flavobacterium sp. N2270]|uniref:transcriptional regulator n=1 Tax=Flavobacterium sp. N2270 TaxID=2986831 RepID=UPI0022241685|nr:transcriptional regulator [Flavobacterium sp. N2270]